MVYSTNLFTSGNTKVSTMGSNTPVAVRVRDIILDRNHPEFDKYDREDAIGVIKFTYVDSDKAFGSTEELPGAFPLDSTLNKYPVINEIVFVRTALIGEQSDSFTRLYYSKNINLYKGSNHDCSPYDETLGLGYDNFEDTTISPLLPYPGDTIIQGRLGQSLRFSGYNSPHNPLTNENNNTSPFTILRNGQFAQKKGTQHVIEDINNDISSIYLTSDHKLPISASQTNWQGSNELPSIDTYQGSQIVLNSGKLYFNSKEEDIILTAQEDFGVSSNSAHISAKEYIGFDAEKIYLGKGARILDKRNKAEPLIKGDRLEVFLDSLLSVLNSMLTTMLANPTKNTQAPALAKKATSLLRIVKSLKRDIRPGKEKSFLKSKKTYTE